MTMNLKEKLVQYHHSEDPLVFRWNSRIAVVQLSRWCVTLVPGRDAKAATPTAYRRGLTQLLEAEASKRASIRVGALSAWANRRTIADQPDPQRVLDATYNRGVIRESLQWLYQQRVADNAVVSIRTVPTDGHRLASSALEPGHALVMTCGVWTGITMCRIGDHVGDDPLLAEAP